MQWGCAEPKGHSGSLELGGAVVRCLDGLGFLIPTLPSGNQLWSCGPLVPLSAYSFLPP